MGHAFICEYCECYHTATDGCDEYNQNRDNRIMVNNETQKENEMALEDVLAQKWQAFNHKDVLVRLRVYNESRARMDQGEDSMCVDAAKEIATLRGKLRIFLRRRDSEWEGDDLRAENDRLEDEIHSVWKAARGENALRLEAEQERDDLRAKVEEAYIYVVESECSCLPYASPEHGGMCERCVWLEGRDDG